MNIRFYPSFSGEALFNWITVWSTTCARVRYTRTFKESRHLQTASNVDRSVSLALQLFQFSKRKMYTYRYIVLPVILNECKTWCFTLRDENNLREFENMVLRKTFWSKRDEANRGTKENCTMRSLMTSAAQQTSFD